ncbi:MAG: 3-dehydroquinate synthase family protein [Planctomycetota bacterium]
MSPETIRVALPGGRGYDVIAGTDLLASLGERARAALPPASKAAIVHDAGVPDTHLARARASLESAGFSVASKTVRPSERDKSLDTLRSLLEWLALERLARSDVVIALGGGIVGDVAGFAAASHRRGCGIVQCPTTLLAMVDASVGGKTGVNLEIEREGRPQLLKNAVGAFHQPSLVLADIDVLESLDPRDFRAGLAECIKHGMIAGAADDSDLSSWLDQNLARIAQREPETLARLVARDVAVKASIVADDEKETDPSGGRALLNLGHTFAHVIESISGFDLGTREPGVRHGEAVALGLIAASKTASELGLVDRAFIEGVRASLAAAGLPTRSRGFENAALGPDALISRMLDDKKSADDGLRLVLPMGPGTARVLESPALSAVHAGWEMIGAGARSPD